MKIKRMFRHTRPKGEKEHIEAIAQYTKQIHYLESIGDPENDIPFLRQMLTHFERRLSRIIKNKSQM